MWGFRVYVVWQPIKTLMSQLLEWASQLSDYSSHLALSFSLSRSYGAAKLHPLLLYGLVVTVIIWSLWALYGESGFGFIYGGDSGLSSIASLRKTATSFEGRRQQRMAIRDVRCIQLSWNVERSLKTNTELNLTFDAYIETVGILNAPFVEYTVRTDWLWVQP